jgi:hypothetical protein
MMNFKMGEKTTAAIHDIFKGLFSLVDLGVKAFTFVAKSVMLFVNALSPATGGVLSFTGGIGNFISGINEAIESNDLMTKGLEQVGKVADFVGSIVQGIGDIFAYACILFVLVTFIIIVQRHVSHLRKILKSPALPDEF